MNSDFQSHWTPRHYFIACIRTAEPDDRLWELNSYLGKPRHPGNSSNFYKFYIAFTTWLYRLILFKKNEIIIRTNVRTTNHLHTQIISHIVSEGPYPYDKHYIGKKTTAILNITFIQKKKIVHSECLDMQEIFLKCVKQYHLCS